MRIKTSFLVLGALVASSAVAQNVFEGFEDGNAASRFTVVSTSADTEANFAVAYSGILNYNFGATIGNPDPNATGDLGLRLIANDGGGGTVEGINVYYNNLNRTGTGALRFDMYMRFDEGNFSTEYGLAGFNHSTQTGTWNSLGPVATSGYWFSGSADGGTTRDYRFYKSGTEDQTAANYVGGSQGNTGPGFSALFPDLDGADPLNDPGQLGNRWVQVELSYDSNTGQLLWKMKKLEDATWTTCYSKVDASPFQDTGTFQFGLTDPFSSQSQPGSYTLIDNVEMVNRAGLVLPRKETLVTGLAFGGDVTSLFNSDDNSLFILNDENDPNAEQQVSTTSPITGATSMSLTFETGATRTDLSQFTEAFNYATNQWVSIDVRSSTLADQVVVWNNTTNASEFINGTTREAKMRFRWIPQQDLEAADGWSESIDQVIWDIN